MGRILKMAAVSLVAAMAGASLSLPAQAQTGRVAVGAGVGTTGVSGEVQLGLTRHFALRSSYNHLEYKIDEKSFDDIEYSSDLDASTVGAFIDAHPFANGFTITAGAYLGGKRLGFGATPNGTVEIGAMTYTPQQVGTLLGSAELEENAGYLGIGFDNALYGSGRWSFHARAGVMFTGSPHVELVSVGGTLSNDAAFLADLQDEADNIAEEVEDYEYYPVVNLGVSARL